MNLIVALKKITVNDQYICYLIQEVVDRLKSGLVHCLPPAKRFRMFCVAPIIKRLRAHESLEYDEVILM